jgi:hypothetical protein
MISSRRPLIGSRERRGTLEPACIAICIAGLVWLCPLPAAGQQRPYQDEPPVALRNMVAFRSALRTGIVQCSVLERDTRGEHLKYATARIAGDDVIWINRGDEAGVVVRDTTGAPARTATQLPLSYLSKDGLVWHKEGGASSAEAVPAAEIFGPQDFRTLGVSTGFGCLDLETTVWTDGSVLAAPQQYEESTDQDGLSVVTARSGEKIRKWWIDPKRGWSVVRAALYVNGELWGESRSPWRISQTDGTRARSSTIREATRRAESRVWSFMLTPRSLTAVGTRSGLPPQT